MKVIKTEEFASPERKKDHFVRHVNNKSGEFFPSKFKSAERYEEAADRLAATPVNTSDLNSQDDVVGFIEFKEGRESYVKYNKKTRELVVYVPSKAKAPKTGNLILTFYWAHPDKYNRLFDDFYLKEINDD